MKEDLVFFPCGDRAMVGVPPIPRFSNGLCVISPWGAGAFPSSARNQYRARLASELAAKGYHSFRFDYPGVGEAGGIFRVPTLTNPYGPEILAASEWLKSKELVRFIIVANCFSAWSSLVVAPLIDGLEVEERIEGFPTLASQDLVANLIREWLALVIKPSKEADQSTASHRWTTATGFIEQSWAP